MDILLCSIIYPPDVCSNAYVFADLTEEFIRRGHRVTVITTTPHYGGSAEELLEGKAGWYRTSKFHGASVFHICVGNEKGGALRHLDTYARFHHYAPKLVKLEQIKADVVLAQTPPPILAGHTAKRLGKRLRAKSVLILQDAWVDNLLRRKRIGKLVYRILNGIEKSVYSKQNAVVTLSEDMGKTVRHKLKWPERLQIIPNPVNTEIYHPREITEEQRKKYRVAETDFVVSYVGNLGGAQDILPLIEYAKKRSDVKVLIAGNGKRESEYRKAAENVDNIVFLGYISREETTEVNAISDVCMVMLSEYISDTCFPSKLPTIMAMGRPIALCCRPDCGVARYVVENEIGLTSDVNDAESFVQMMERFREDGELRKNCADNAFRAAMRDFSLQSVGDQYEKLLRTVRRSKNALAEKETEP